MSQLSPWRNAQRWVEQVSGEMEHAFRRAYNPSESTPEDSVWAPRIDVSESEQGYTIKADLPGVDPKAVEVVVQDDTVVISGEKPDDRGDLKTGVHRLERFVGHFRRVLSLPKGVDASGVTATSARGVLSVFVPKRADAKPRRVNVSVDAE